MSAESMSVYLSVGDLERLTGKKRSSAQIRWLKDHGYRFAVNGLNQPIVAVAESDRKLVGGAPLKQQEPNWEAMTHRGDNPRPPRRR